MKGRFKRVFVRWELCEEYKTLMWKQVPVADRDGYITKSADLMKDCAEFESALKMVVDKWPNSTKAALTAATVNHQAWMGHAGCAINHNAPEDLTRIAWRSLTKQEQDSANQAADRAIEYWEEKYEVDHA